MKQKVLYALAGVIAIGAILGATTLLGAGGDIENAREAVYTFLGERDPALRYVETRSSPCGDVYVFQGGKGVFEVHARTGEVESAVFFQSPAGSTAVAIPPDRAEAIASAYAGQKYANFTTIPLQRTESTLVQHGDAPSDYRFAWEEVVNNATTPNRVHVIVNAHTGEIVSYAGTYRELTVGTEPRIAESDAIRTALDQFSIPETRTRTKLSVTCRDDHTQALLWEVDVRNAQESISDRGGVVAIDAMTGEIVSVRHY